MTANISLFRILQDGTYALFIRKYKDGDIVYLKEFLDNECSAGLEGDIHYSKGDFWAADITKVLP